MQHRAGALDLHQLLLDSHARRIDRVADGGQLVEGRVHAMVLQPQSLPQHLLHGVADRVLVAAGDRLDLDARGSQALLEGIGGVQKLGHRPLPAPPQAPQDQGRAGEDRGEQQQEQR